MNFVHCTNHHNYETGNATRANIEVPLQYIAFATNKNQLFLLCVRGTGRKIFTMSRNFVTDDLQNAMKLQQAEHLKAISVPRSIVYGLISLPLLYFWMTVDTTKDYEESNLLHYGKYVNFFLLLYSTLMAVTNTWTAIDAILTLRKQAGSFGNSSVNGQSPSSVKQRITFESSPSLLDESGTGKQTRKCWPYELSPTALAVWQPRSGNSGDLDVSKNSADMSWRNFDANSDSSGLHHRNVSLNQSSAARGPRVDSPLRNGANLFDSPTPALSTDAYMHNRQSSTQGLLNDGSAYRLASQTNAAFGRFDPSSPLPAGTLVYSTYTTTTVKQVIIPGPAGASPQFGCSMNDDSQLRSPWNNTSLRLDPITFVNARHADRDRALVAATHARSPNELDKSGRRECEIDAVVEQLSSLFGSVTSESRWLRAIGLLREWLARTVVQRVADRLADLRSLLEAAGFAEDTLATCSIAQLAKLADSQTHPDLTRAVRELLPFLEVELSETHDESACACVVCTPSGRPTTPAPSPSAASPFSRVFSGRAEDEHTKRALALVGTSQYIVRRIVSLAQSNSLFDYRAEAGSELLGWPLYSNTNVASPLSQCRLAGGGLPEQSTVTGSSRSASRCAAVRALPSDAQLLLHLLCTYLDCVLPQRADAKKPFTDVYVHVATAGFGCRDAALCSYETHSRSTELRDGEGNWQQSPRRRRCASSNAGRLQEAVGVRILCEHRIEGSERRMQCDLLVRTDNGSSTRVPITGGRNNVFLCMLAFFFYLREYEGARVGGQLSLGASGLNVARIFDE